MLSNIAFCSISLHLYCVGFNCFALCCIQLHLFAYIHFTASHCIAPHCTDSTENEQLIGMWSKYFESLFNIKNDRGKNKTYAGRGPMLCSVGMYGITSYEVVCE